MLKGDKTKQRPRNWAHNLKYTNNLPESGESILSMTATTPILHVIMAILVLELGLQNQSRRLPQNPG